MSAAPVASASWVTRSPPTTSDSLLASARSIPSPRVATVGPSPAEPTRALRTSSAPDSVTRPHEPLGAGEHLALGPRLRRARGRRGIGERDAPDAVRARLLDQALPRALGAQADQLEVVGARDDLERLRADRAGGAEDEQLPGHGPRSVRRAPLRPVKP